MADIPVNHLTFARRDALVSIKNITKTSPSPKSVTFWQRVKRPRLVSKTSSKLHQNHELGWNVVRTFS